MGLLISCYTRTKGAIPLENFENYVDANVLQSRDIITILHLYLPYKDCTTAVMERF